MATATIIKCGKRSARRTCPNCGAGGPNASHPLWWGHDSSRTGTANCRDHGSGVSLVMVEEDGTVHPCMAEKDYFSLKTVAKAGKPKATGAASAWQPMSNPAANLMPTTAPVQAPVAAPETPTVAAATPVNGQAPTGAYAAFTAFMDALAPKVDAEQVNAIIDERLRSLDDLAVPFRVELRKPDGTVKAVKGMAHAVLPRLIRIVGNARKHVFMVGMAGSGKSTLAEQVAEALDLEFSSMSVGPTTSGTEIKGYMTSVGNYVTTEFRKRFEFGGIMLLDEVDTGNPGIFTMINAALANGQMAFPDGMVAKHPDFRCMAAGNTFGRGPDRMYVGRQQMDYATLDRFIVITVDIDEKLETAMCYGTGLDKSTVDAVLTYTRKLRANVISQRMAVLVTPRASEGMCACLAAGDTAEEAIDGAVRKGLSDSDWANVTRGVYAHGF